jgi:hypothetical protein
MKKPTPKAMKMRSMRLPYSQRVSLFNRTSKWRKNFTAVILFQAQVAMPQAYFSEPVTQPSNLPWSADAGL